MLARILRNRDLVTDEEISNFLYGSLSDLHDPFLLKGMDEAVQAARGEMARGTKICIMGDYDSDGVCSSFILKSYFDYAGAKSTVCLPDRVRDGYGMNVRMVREAFEDGAGLIITCDNGISCHDAVAEAKELGMTVIVTDHHEVSAGLPCADAVVDPRQEGCQYPFKDICGAVVAWKFVQAMLKDDAGAQAAALIDYLLQFAAVATVTDIMPLKDENRISVREGLKRLSVTGNRGLRALMELKGISGQSITSFHVGFVIGPCLNSAGRLESADEAFDLLYEKDPEKAAQTAGHLNELNEKRKQLTSDQIDRAQELINKDISEKGSPDRIIVCFLPEAHESIAGIVAGHLKEEYNRPAFIITGANDGLKGSGRSIPAYNMIEALTARADLMQKFGGHAGAAGFTLDCSVEEFRNALNEDCTLTASDLERTVWLDMRLPFEYVSPEFVKELELLEPFGTGNDKPLFAEKDITVLKSSVVGKNRTALKMVLENAGGARMDAVYFSSPENISAAAGKTASGSKIMITYYPSINEWRGMQSLQIVIRDIRFQ